MTSISASYILYDLKSPLVVEGLRRHDHSIIDGIASRPYSKVLQVMQIGDDSLHEDQKRDEKLKWMLHTQVAVFGSLLNIQEALNQSVASPSTQLKAIYNLIYDFKFLIQDLLGLHYDFGYPTWNLLQALESDSLGKPEISEFLRILVDGVTCPTKLTCGLFQRPLMLDLDGLVCKALTSWLDCSVSYSHLMNLFYETEDPNFAVFGFQAVTALSSKLLAVTHCAELSLSAIHQLGLEKTRT